MPPIDSNTQTNDAKLITSNLERAAEQHDPQALHRAQLEFLTILQDDPDAFKNIQNMVLINLSRDLQSKPGEFNQILGDFQLLGVDKPENNIKYIADGHGGFSVTVKDKPSFHIGADNSYAFTDAGGKLLEPEQQMEANAKKIAQDILTNTDESIHRAQMETLAMYKAYGNSAELNALLTQVYLDVKRTPGDHSGNIAKFGLINLGNGCSPDSGTSGGTYDVSTSDTGCTVSWVGPDGVKHDPLVLTEQKSDFFRLDPETGLLGNKYDASTVESWLSKSGDHWSWYHAGQQLYSLRKHLTDAEFNAVCKQILEDSAKEGSGLPKSMTLTVDSGGNVVAVDIPGQGEIFNQSIADGGFWAQFGHLFQSSENAAAD